MVKASFGSQAFFQVRLNVRGASVADGYVRDILGGHFLKSHPGCKQRLNTPGNCFEVLHIV